MHLNWVTPQMAVSGRVPLDLETELKNQGVSAVLNLTIKPDPQWAFPTMNDGQPDNGMPRSPDWFQKGVSFALRTIHSGGKVLIHCESGVHRAPSMAYAVLRSMGQNPVQAEHTVLAKVPGANVRYKADAEKWLAANG